MHEIYEMKAILLSGICLSLSLRAFYSAFAKKAQKLFHNVSVDEIDAQTLVVTDINDTIITCHDSFWQKETLSSLSGSAKAKLSGLNLSQMNLLSNLVMQKSKNVEVSGASYFFNKLKKKNISTLALTAAFAEPLDGIDMADLVVKELQAIGIKFSGPLTGVKVFTELKKDKVSGGYPTLLQESVLLTNGTTSSKGDVLKAYIESIPASKRPLKVLFFDDSATNLKSVSEVLKPLGIKVRTVKADPKSQGLMSPSAKQEKLWESLIDRSLLV